MNSENPKKKLHFFNGGRGINLSQFEEESPEGSCSAEEAPYGAQNSYYPRQEDEDDSLIEHPLEDAPYGQDESLDNFPTSNYPESNSGNWGYEQSHCSSSPMRSMSPSPRPFSPSMGQHFSTSPTYCPTYNSLEMQTNLHSYQGHIPGPNPLPIMPKPHYPSYLSMPGHPQANPSLFPGPSMVQETSYGQPSQHPIFLGHHQMHSPLRPMENGAHGLPYSAVTHYGMEAGDHRGEEYGSRKKKRQQKCSLCSNHDIQTDVKGHKWFCPYRNCDCQRCVVTKGRQHHMKEQQKLTRHLHRARDDPRSEVPSIFDSR